MEAKVTRTEQRMERPEMDDYECGTKSVPDGRADPNQWARAGGKLNGDVDRALAFKPVVLIKSWLINDGWDGQTRE